jgi:hypothetical protein
MSQYWYYNMDGSQIPVQVFDDLVSVSLDSSSGYSAAMYAQLKTYLRDDFEPFPLPSNASSYRIEDGYTLSQVMDSLRSDPKALMVNPVLRSPYDDTTYLPNDFIVRYLDGVTQQQIDALNQQLDVELLRVSEFDSSCCVLGFMQKTSSTVFDICNAYYEAGLCHYSEPNFVFLHCYDAIPNDAYFQYQWSYMNTGANGGTPDADIDMAESYDYNKGDSKPMVYILDSGFDMEHEDLRANWFKYPFDVCGPNEYRPVADNWPEYPCTGGDPQCWHGTAVMGIHAAWSNNTLGLAGIDPGQTGRYYIVPVKISGELGVIRSINAVTAFQYVSGTSYAGGTNNHIVSCSWTLPQWSSALHTAIQQCYTKGMPVFFASGNGGYVPYPAYLPNVMAVGASDRNDQVPWWSGQGWSLDVVAPGVDVWSFDLTGDLGIVQIYGDCIDDFGVADNAYYCHYSGASFATSLVAGIAAEVLARRPDFFDEQSPERVYSIIGFSAEDKGAGGYDPEYGCGRVNADRAMLSVTHGDCNNDGLIDIDDIVYLINYAYGGGPEPVPHPQNGNANCSNEGMNPGDIDIDDIVYLINHVIGGGPEPPDCFFY